MPEFDTPEPIRSLLPRGPGHRFVIYGDSCSGISGAPHEQTFSAVNAVLRRLTPPPEFILFAGDEIAGLTADSDELRAQTFLLFDPNFGAVQFIAFERFYAILDAEFTREHGDGGGPVRRVLARLLVGNRDQRE